MHPVRTRVISATVVHLAAVVFLLAAARLVPERVEATVLPPKFSDKIVWLSQPGPGGGGGGGGNRRPDPPPAQLNAPDPVTVPASPTVVQPAEEILPEPPTEPTAIPARMLAAGTETVPGAIASGSTSGIDSRGPGDGPGFGPGNSPGEGRGDKGGVGDGPYQVGNGVLPPRIRHKVEPQYSSAAVQAKIKGVVLLSAVVLPDGSVTDVRVIRSLDRTFGLDRQAIEAARQWLFFPGTRQGQPVPVLVHIELEFNLQ